MTISPIIVRRWQVPDDDPIYVEQYQDTIRIMIGNWPIITVDNNLDQVIEVISTAASRVGKEDKEYAEQFRAYITQALHDAQKYVQEYKDNTND